MNPVSDRKIFDSKRDPTTMQSPKRIDDSAI
jgi:hypothetical protein